MPIYEYECPNCKKIEITKGMNDKDPEVCPTCGEKITRLFSMGGFDFKGEGWTPKHY